MQNRTKLFISAVLLIIMILSMVTPALATETERTTEHVHTWTTLSATKDRHYLFCTTCNETQDEPHTFNSEEICIVCARYFHTHKWQRIEADLQFHTVVCTGCGESETEPVDTKPAKTEPVDTKLAEREPVDTLPVETEPVETEPTETNPTEVTSGEADPEETETEASDTFDEEDGEVNSKPDGSTLIWVVAVVSIAAGLITGLFLWKKKSS